MTKEVYFYDKIAKICLEHFNKLPKCGKPNNNEWTILSCTVQESNNGKLEVVALGTGTKCIGKDKMSENGDILNDSHAEIVCRRAFLRYLYETMLFEENVLLKYDPEKHIFILENGIKFHFFTTHVPCGDAAIFAKQNVEHFGNILKNSNNLQQIIASDDKYIEGIESKRIKLDDNISNDIYRTGAKCLQNDVNQDLKLPGTDYHVTGVVRTKPGRGVQTLSVSCSDKIAKWCHLGVQGALLSILLNEPIYFHSFTVAGGTPFNKEAIQRAFADRLGNVSLEHPYDRREMVVNQSHLTFPFSKSNEKRPGPSSIIWMKTYSGSCRQVEVAVDGRRQGVTKKQMKTAGMLKISKCELFKCFVKVIKTFQIPMANIDNFLYKDVKLQAKSYQEAWNILRKYFKVWTIKDDNLLNFGIY